MSRFYSPKPIEYSPGDKRSAMECRETISGYLETQRLVENIVSTAALPVEIGVPPPKASNPSCLRDITEEACCQKREIYEFKHVAKLPNPNRRDNCVPLKWESPLTQAIRTTAPDADTFSQIPPRYPGSALATALAVAPSAPFTPSGTHCEEIPLPEETVPYFPPAGSERNEQEEVTKPPKTQGDSQAISGTPPQRRKKKKDPTDKYFEDLPKPQETLSLRTALTTAPERPYSPLIIESTGTMEAAMNDNGVERSQFRRHTKPEVLPSSFQMNEKEPKPPSYYSPVILQRKIEETSSEKCIPQSDTSKNITIQNPQVEHEEHVAQNFPPLFQGFSCSFQNKTEHSQFSVEVMTTPPVMSPLPQQIINKLKTTSGYIQEENSIEEQCELHHTSKKVEKKEIQEIAKQEELMVTRKPVQPVYLHKPEHLPQYQVEISAEAEAELMRMQKMQKAQSKLEQQKQQSQATQLIAQQQPIIKIESEVESRPGCITQSLTNKPPPVIPYYQANLVPQHMSAPAVHLFDPKSPDISRSPSPCLGGRDRSCSPGAQVRSNMGVVSPASDLPRNPSETAQQPKQMYQMLMKTRSYAQPMEQSRLETAVMEESVIEQNNSLRRKEQTLEGQRFDSSRAHKTQKFMSQRGETIMSTSVDEQSKQAHMEQLKKSQVESVERSKEGTTQIQRKKIVTEEFERHQKETNIQIDKNVTTTRRLPFHEVNAPSVDRDSIKGHVTDPRPLSLPFSQSTGGQKLQQQVPNASSAPTKRASAPCSTSLLNLSNKPNQPSVSSPDTGTVSGRQTGGVSVAPKRGRGVLNAASLAGARIPLCGSCNMQIRGPFITALGKIWCPNHFICVTPSCRRPLQDMGFVEEHGQLYCEICFEQYLAPPCSKCSGKIRGDCLKAIGKNFHPECFNCTYCGKLFGNSPFFLEDGSPYCETDWNELFTTKCFACGFPVEAGDRWVEALNNNYHSQCFNCTMCKKNLEGQSFFAKGGRPFCKNHAR